jgi:hypothetical protein
MKLTLKELQLALNYGEVVVLQDCTNEKYVAVGGCGKDFQGDYRSSDWRVVEEGVTESLGAYGGLPTNEYTQQDKYKYIKSFAHAITDRVPVGTRVRVLENVDEELRRFGMLVPDLVDFEYVAEILSNTAGKYEVFTRDGKDTTFLPRTAFTLITGEGRTYEDVLKDLSKEDRKIIEEYKSV